MKKFTCAMLVLCAVLILVPSHLFAADFPTKPVKIVVPFAAGGAADMTTRLAAQIAEKYLGQPITVENRPGGGSVTGITAVYKSRPDGYTLCQVGPSFIIGPLTKKTSYTANDFTPIVNMVYEPETIAAKSDRFKDWASLEAYSKANPGAIKIGVSGAMASDHLAVLRVLKKTGLNWVCVPTNGSSQAITALLGGHVDLTIVSPSELSEQVRSGEVSYIFTLAPKRLALYPDLPTGKDLDIDVVDGPWRGLVAPKGTPEEALKAIEDAYMKAFADPAFKEAYAKADMPADMWMNRKDFTALVEQQKIDIAEVIKETGAKK